MGAAELILGIVSTGVGLLSKLGAGTVTDDEARQQMLASMAGLKAADTSLDATLAANDREAHAAADALPPPVQPPAAAPVAPPAAASTATPSPATAPVMVPAATGSE